MFLSGVTPCTFTGAISENGSLRKEDSSESDVVGLSGSFHASWQQKQSALATDLTGSHIIWFVTSTSLAGVSSRFATGHTAPRFAGGTRQARKRASGQARVWCFGASGWSLDAGGLVSHRQDCALDLDGRSFPSRKLGGVMLSARQPRRLWTLGREAPFKGQIAQAEVGSRGRCFESNVDRGFRDRQSLLSRMPLS